MANYQETTGTASAWKRCNKILIENSLTSSNNIIMFEEDVVSIGDKIVTSEVGALRAQFDPEAIIQLRDPLTGELTGAIAYHSFIYQALYSFYMNKALERDAAQASQA